MAVESLDINVALGRSASQSSVWNDHGRMGYCVAAYAVDGNNNTNLYSKPSCAHTADPPDGPNWWRVHIGQAMHIKQIVITNRGDVQKYSE